MTSDTTTPAPAGNPNTTAVDRMRYAADHAGGLGGQLPAHAWPGGYPILYITADCDVLCPACANGENESDINDPDVAGDPAWTITGAGIHWEGPPETCGHCQGEIESAYGDPDADAESDDG